MIREHKKLFGSFLVIASAGCVTLAPFSLMNHHSCQVHSVHTAWENKIVVTEDTVNQGAPLPGLAGRMWLFGADLGTPLRCSGKVIVELVDAGPSGSEDAKNKERWRWEFDPHALKKLARQDIVGWGYTLFLPWPDCPKDIQRVQLQVCFVPEKGSPLFAPKTHLTLRPENKAVVKREQTILPSAGMKK